ncbi:MAG TPA: VIT domain-containing protein [Gemmataceae bacterium]|nr:VIT domain-containing protein [Gemmataceae bacterium]
MRTVLLSLAVLFAVAGPLPAHGLLIPEDRQLPPLAMVNHRVKIDIQDQVAVTEVEQSFRNHTDRPLEATYVFPVPRGASVNKFTMLVDGKEQSAEMVESAKARQIYNDIVRRTQDPGLLEYIDNNLLRVRVFPVPPHKDQKLTLRYSSIAPEDGGLIEYVYPLKTDGKATRTLEEFSIKATIKSTHSLLNVYSPTHSISSQRTGERTMEVTFDREQAALDKDFQLFYSVGRGEVGFTPLTYRPLSTEDGYFLFLISPQLDVSRGLVQPRDMVFVLDTSGSMAGVKMEQAKKALRHCLDNMNPEDRFAVFNFSTAVGKYREQLVESSREQIDNAKRWVDNLRTSGGTAIDDAMAAAQALHSDSGRTFTIVFFTDGQPTVGETNPDKILKHVTARNTANTRIFTFGVGDDVNAALLDQLAEQTRAVSTYVRPAEDIEVKASALYAKVSQPVLTNLKLTAGDAGRLSEIYPPQLPDLFAGGQVLVLGRYSGQGPVAITLTGTVGGQKREYVYEMNLAPRGGEDREFVEHLWARRKVGYLLDQVRLNGEKKELIDEVTAIAKKYGIATPYTSYLIVPDAPTAVLSTARGAGMGAPSGPAGRPLALQPGGGGIGGIGGIGGGFGGATPPASVADFARQVQAAPGNLPQSRDQFESARLRGGFGKDGEDRKLLAEAVDKKFAFDEAKAALGRRAKLEVQAGKLGVDFAIEANNLKAQSRLTPIAQRKIKGRTCLEIGGVWIDEGYDAKMPIVTVKAQSPAYFRILERQPGMRDLFRLGNYLLWVTPNQTALVIDTTQGKEDLTDAEIDALFSVR